MFPNRAICSLVAAVGVCLPADSGEATEANVLLRPHAAVQPVPTGDAHWTGGFWADRLSTCRDNSLPAMWTLMSGTAYKPYYRHFLIAAGKEPGTYHGAPFNDGDFYKFLEACSAVLAVGADDELRAVVDQSIAAIGAAQREDGYIHTPVLVRQRNGDATVVPFADRHNFEMYNMGHLLLAACVHTRATGEESFLTIARKAADFLCHSFENPTPEQARNSICPAHYMGMIEMYRVTNEPRYLKTARTFLAMRDLVAGGGDDNQDRVPFAEQREVVGHAVRANYLYAGAADLVAETGDLEMRQSLAAVWDNMITRKMHITGGCGALYDGASPDGSEQQGEITRVHQAYGRNYQLPNLTAHNETCANIGNVLWSWRMYLLTGESKYIDVVELALYNSVLSGVSLEGTDYFYVNPLRQTTPLPSPLRWSRTRVPFVTSFCCPPNLLRTIAQASGYAYGKSAGAVWVNLYGSSRLTTSVAGGRLRLEQQTGYPWDGGVRLTVYEAPVVPLGLHLRIPGWAEGAEITVNGLPADRRAIAGTFFELRGRWKAGDTVDLVLPLTPRLIEAHPLVEENRNQVAIQRGPMVYCLESPDLPEGVRVQDVVVPLDVAFEVLLDSELAGVAELEADVLARRPRDWDGRLYQSVESEPLQEITARFIPYFTWSNRGPSEMSVWLPMRP